MSDSFVTSRTVACQVSLSMEFSRKEHWSGLPLPPTGDLPDPGLNLCLSHWQADSLPLSHHRSAYAKAVSSNIAFGDKIFGK